MMEGVGSGLAVVQVGRGDPFGVAVGVFAGGESAFSTSRLWGPQARVSSLMWVRRVAFQPLTWWTWLW